jgi:DNA polymerase II small subunit
MTDDIILKFAEADLLIDDKAYQEIMKQNNSLKFTESLIKDLNVSQRDLVVLTGDVLEKYLEKDIPTPDLSSVSLNNTIEDRSQTVSQTELMPSNLDFEIIMDASRKSYTNGEIKDFSTFFANRFHKLKDLLIHKHELRSVSPIRDVENSQDAVSVIGMVNDVRNTKNNHKLIELEDETGYVTALVHNENHALFEAADKVVKDEVMGVVGSRKGSLLMATEIINPGVP